MGLAFGLSRDEELEKTRLDLERARMEREDFRNGGETARMALKTSKRMCEVLLEDLDLTVAALKRIAVCGNSEAVDEADDVLRALGYNEDSDSEQD
jgi:hypothetical protein